MAKLFSAAVALYWVVAVNAVLDPKNVSPLGDNYYRSYAKKQLLQRQAENAALSSASAEADASTIGLLFRPGSVWPKPQLQTQSNNVMKISNAAFTFQHVSELTECALLDGAMQRYQKMILRQQRVFGPKIATDDATILYNVSIHLDVKCDDDAYPPADMDEHYVIKIDPQFGSYLFAVSQWGLLRAFESFAQLTYSTADGVLVINETLLNDWPRFAHRGLMIDTARHFIPLSQLQRNLDAMSYNKFNVFHWHIVDDQSFPFESERFPNMSTLGAFPPSALHQYTTGQVRSLIDYARARGIRVMPEFDTPGHSSSWGAAMPQLLTQCYDNKSQPITGKNYDAPFDPTHESLYTFLAHLFGEIFERFPDTYVHLGGDEVDFTCWESNPQIQQWMAAQNYGNDYAKLQSYYQTRLLKTLNATQRSDVKHEFVVWQEVFDNGAQLDNQSIVHVWYVDDRWHDKMAQVTAAGLKALLSSCWYLNLISYGEDWVDYYKCDPHNFNGTDAQKRLVVGGEVTMWSEYVDGTNVLTRTWPRAAPVAERLWSNASATQDVDDARLRLRTQRCRMIERGLPVEPITWAVYGPDFCPIEYGTFDDDKSD